MSTVYIGIGSNIEAEQNLIVCAEKLRSHFPNLSFSSVYKTAARDAEDQDDFFNAVAKIETDHSPIEVQSILTGIEEDLGKNPPYEKGPRTIDLDILLFGSEMLQSDALSIPHPRMHQRRFVLEPLCELLEPSQAFPGSATSFGDLLQKTQDQDCERVDFTL